MSKYITLVFNYEALEQKQGAIRLSQLDECRAWSIGNEVLRVSLLHKAIYAGDLERAKRYISADDIEMYAGDLDE